MRRRRRKRRRSRRRRRRRKRRRRRRAPLGQRGTFCFLMMASLTRLRGDDTTQNKASIGRAEALTVGAGGGGAVVDLLLAGEAGVARGTLAVVPSVGVVGAAAAVEAGPVSAGHGTQLTVPPVEAGRAGAPVGVLLVLQGGGQEVRRSGGQL